MLAIALLAKNMGVITSQDIVDELFGGLPKALGKSLLHLAVFHGLLEYTDDRGNEARLSEQGSELLDKNRVLTPMEDAWCFYYVADPLLPAALLHAERTEKKFKTKIEELRKLRRGESKDNSSNCPELLKECEDVLLNSVVDSGPFKVQTFNRGEDGQEMTLQLTLAWEENQPSPRIYLDGRLLREPIEENRQSNQKKGQASQQSTLSVEKYEVEFPKEPTEHWTYPKLWAELAWLSGQCVDCSPEGLQELAKKYPTQLLPTDHHHQFWSPEARRELKSDLSIPASTHEGLGEFESTTFKDVQLLPKDEPAAQAWANWLQWETLSEYQTPNILSQHNQFVLEKFTWYQLSLPDAQELLESAIEQPATEQARYLLTPFDLGLWR